jgi:hypothetical protein
MHGENDRPGSREVLADLPRDLQATQAGHHHVHNQHIRLEAFHKLHCF